MVLLDEEYVRGRKVFGQVVCTFRYGREEDEVMGLNFYKELFLASEQIYPPPEKRGFELTKTQVTLSHHIAITAHSNKFNSRSVVIIYNDFATTKTTDNYRIIVHLSAEIEHQQQSELLPAS